MTKKINECTAVVIILIMLLAAYKFLVEGMSLEIMWMITAASFATSALFERLQHSKDK